MTKKQIKEIFKKEGVQLGSGALEMILEQLKRESKFMAIRCKQGNLKRLTPDLFWVALGNDG